MADLIKKTDTLNQGREKLNTAITDAETAKNISAEADDKATQALAQSESTQTQLDTIVIEGDSSVEAAQARVSMEGTAYGTLKERLDAEHQDVTSQLAQTATEITEIQSNKMDKDTNDISVSQINKNKGKLDQTYMTDEFVQQMAGTTPINTVPANYSLTTNKFADKSITARVTDFIKSSTNLFNKKTEHVGYNISSTDGTLVSNGGYNTSDYIPIKPSTDYSYLGFANVAYYGENKQFLSRPGLTYAGQTLTSPSNAFFVRVHYQPSSSYQRQMNEGSALLSYEEFYQVLNGIDVTLKNQSVTNDKLGLLSVGTENLINKSVSEEKVTFIESNSNMFNHNTITENVAILADGSISSHSSYSISDFIVVDTDQIYSEFGFTYVAYYDSNMNFLSRTGFLTTNEHETFTTSSDTRFVRLMYQHTLIRDKQMNIGSVLLPYEPYALIFNNVLLSQQMIDNLKKDEDIAKAVNPTDSYMLDLPINDVFSTPRTYDTYTDFRYTTSAEVYQMYDNLMAQYPDYITKEVLGNDAWGNPIALYKFTPYKPSTDVNTRYPKVFLTSGTHGYEHVPGLVTYLMFEDICKQWNTDPLLEALRFNVDFLVIPVVTPSAWDDYTRKNRNGVDINRNFPEGWVLVSDPANNQYGGTEPLSELEAQYVSSVFDNNPDIDVMYDFHNFAGGLDTEEFIWIPTGSGAYVQHMAQMLISRMTRKWRSEYDFIPDNHDWFVGTTDSTHNAMIQDHARERGIKFSATFEVAGRWWLEPAASIEDLPYNTTHKVTSVEALVNWLLISLNELIK